MRTRTPAKQTQRDCRHKCIILRRGNLRLPRPRLPEVGVGCADLERVPRRGCLLLGRSDEPDEQLPEGRRTRYRIDEGGPTGEIQALAHMQAEIGIVDRSGRVLEKAVDDDGRDEHVGITNGFAHQSVAHQDRIGIDSQAVQLLHERQDKAEAHKGEKRFPRRLVVLFQGLHSDNRNMSMAIISNRPCIYANIFCAHDASCKVLKRPLC